MQMHIRKGLEAAAHIEPFFWIGSTLNCRNDLISRFLSYYLTLPCFVSSRLALKGD